MDKVCRLCGKTPNSSMYNIFNKYNNGQQLIQLIKQCLPILVYRTDPLSKNICETCYTKLNDYSSFQRNTLEVHDKFKLNLEGRIDESTVKLYIDTLENAYQPENIQVTNFRSPRSVRHCACQIKAETDTKSSNTIVLNPPSLKILTPSLINEKSSETAFIPFQNVDKPILKKRRLAGPKSRRQNLNLSYFPPTLLQCALKQINRNLNLIDENSVSDITSETFTEYSISRSASQDRDECYTPLSLLEPNYDVSFNDFNVDIDVNQPAECNYCNKKFDSLLDLSKHELNHMKVDIGPKCDSKEYGFKCRKYVGLYYNYVQRLTGQYPTYVRPNREVKVKPEMELRPKQLKSYGHYPRERTQHIVEEEKNSLLIPNTTANPSNSVFKCENYIVFVNGKPLKSMDKEDRRNYYKDMIINDVKRKYCPLCRHTFKDNWAIEAHYLSDICQFTCKYCGRKFKNQQQLFEQHLKLHKGEPINKVFGPTTRTQKFKKRIKKPGRVVVLPPKVKPIKIKQLMDRKAEVKVNVEPEAMLEPEINIEIKQEPIDEEPPVPSSSTRGRTEPYQAYFCRKCFKVFFNVTEYNKHIRICNGNPRKNSKSSDTKSASSEVSTASDVPRRPIRSCVKEISAITNDSDVDSDDITPKKQKKREENGYECGVCCSSFPTIFSRNSHMRIHKQHQKQLINKVQPPKTILNKVAPRSHTITKQETPQISNHVASNTASDIRLSNLNPAVARLVQNNPHLTIRSFSKAQVEQRQQEKMNLGPMQITKVMESPNDSQEIKRVYKCADCDEKCENKSVLYYHKMNSCIVKRHYECAFCRKKFGTYDQYNTHMFYVHPE